VELAERGYELTGVDLSGRLLSIALSEARRRDVIVNFIGQDARKMEFANKFHAAICLYGGGFGILEDDDENAFLLSKVREALEPGAVFALGAENRLHMEAHPDEFPGFDPETGYHLERQELKLEGGRYEEVETLARTYTEEELRELLEGAGFRVRAVYGVAVGEFAQNEVTEAFRGILATAEAV
jgi:SAM-dependent methyltransferase